MNRFLPDTWLDALMRPLAMGAPNAWVYVEIIAPDLRFIFLIILVLATGFIAVRRRRRRQHAATWFLAAFAAGAFLTWLVTTGNGRYFIPVLLLSGVRCVAFVKAMPLTRSFRLTLVLIMVGLQGFAVAANHPWRPWSGWAMMEWVDAPYFDLSLGAEESTQSATYVTLSVISYALIAPQFPPDSRWVNLSALIGAAHVPDIRRAEAIFQEAALLRLLVPSIPSETEAEGTPSLGAVRAINQLLGQFRLGLKDGKSCRLLPSRTVAAAAAPTSGSAPPKLGFWVCPLSFPVAVLSPSAKVTNRVDQVFEVVERLCPRFFPPGLTVITPIAEGAMRHYQSADMKVYAFDDGSVYYKYYRSLNPEFLGKIDDVLQSGYKLDCSRIRGRSGLPWQREI